MTNWKALVESNEEKILTAFKEAYKDSLENTGMRYVVCIDSDGEISTLQDIAGGNSMYMSVFVGDAIELKSFCNQFFTIDISDDDIIHQMQQDNKYELLQEVIENDAEEENYCLETTIVNCWFTKEDRVYLDSMLENLRQEAFEYEVDSYTYNVEDDYYIALENAELYEQE